MAKPIRRVVTGHNKAGKSIFLSDGAAPVVVSRGTASTTVTELWETRGTPASNRGDEDPTQHPYRLPPPKNGTVFRIIEYPPDKVRVSALRQPGTSHDAAAEGYVRDLANTRHPGFHKTDSVDYAIVLSGEIYALMDEGETLLKAGDVLIQRGTSHAWSNRTDEPATVAFVLIDAEPL
ncbi:MAG TPA: cupin domain-containing protein [Stellaceae bacterium]|nr:cupin domain-containing protein [Stellaceae bacterium]